MYYLKFISKAAHYKTLVLIITYMTVKKVFVQVTVVLKQLACFIILILFRTEKYKRYINILLLFIIIVTLITK